MEIKLEKVTYQDKIKNINYTFEEGKITSIISSTDAGSVIGYLLCGLLENYEGNIENNYIGREIGYVFERPEESFIFDTVYEELSFGLQKYNYKVEEIDKRVNDALKMVKLSFDYLKKSPFTLSSGEKKLLSIATVLILNPKVIIIDNPTYSLDNEREEQLIKLLKKLKTRYNKTIIIISSDIDFILKLSDNYLLLKKDKITSMGKIKELLLNADKLSSANILVPPIIEFIDLARKTKKINLDYTFDIKELMKDIYRNV